MLEENGVEYRYREYRQDPLAEDEIRRLLELLGVPAREVLRSRDPAFRRLGLTGDESEEILIRHMADHPTLLQRPIAVGAGRAVVGRPVERVLDVVPR